MLELVKKNKVYATLLFDLVQTQQLSQTAKFYLNLASHYAPTVKIQKLLEFAAQRKLD